MDNISGVSPEVQDQIIDIICRYKHPEKIIVYGSRATKKHHERSDIDLGIIDPEWTANDVFNVKEDLNEKVSTLLKFDLTHINSISKKGFYDSVMSCHRVIYERKKN